MLRKQLGCRVGVCMWGAVLALCSPSQDSLFFPLLHGEGPHSPNVAQGLIGYTRCPGNLHGVQETGSRLETRGVMGRADQTGRGEAKEMIRNSSTCS